MTCGRSRPVTHRGRRPHPDSRRTARAGGGTRLEAPATGISRDGRSASGRYSNGDGIMRLITAVAVAVGALSIGVSAAQDKAQIERGEKVYVAQKCSLCHSIAGKGNAKGALDGVGSKLSAADIKEWIVNPKEMTAKSKSERKPPMKAYPSLPAADVDALVAYLQTLKK